QGSTPCLSEPVVVLPASEQRAELSILQNMLQEPGLDGRAHLGVTLEIQLRDSRRRVAKDWSGVRKAREVLEPADQSPSRLIATQRNSILRIQAKTLQQVPQDEPTGFLLPKRRLNALVGLTSQSIQECQRLDVVGTFAPLDNEVSRNGTFAAECGLHCSRNLARLHVVVGRRTGSPKYSVCP